MKNEFALEEFLEDLDDQIDDAWDDPDALLNCLSRIRDLRFFDPRTNCADSLVDAYDRISARANCLIRRFYIITGYVSEIKNPLRLSQFSGIELTVADQKRTINSLYQARAKTSSTDTSSPKIIVDNPLTVDWRTVCPGDGEVVLLHDVSDDEIDLLAYFLRPENFCYLISKSNIFRL